MSAFIFEDDMVAKLGERMVVLPKAIKGKMPLLKFLREAVPLPPYFGENWDALEECLGDLDWLCDEGLVLVHQDVPLRDSPHDRLTYLRILSACVHEDKRLRVVFPKRCKKEVEIL